MIVSDYVVQEGLHQIAVALGKVAFAIIIAAVIRALCNK